MSDPMSDPVMTEHYLSGLSAMLVHFPVGSVREVRPVKGGLIHKTFRIESEGGGLFCLQILHPNLSSDAVLLDYQTVTEHLAGKGFPAPRLIKTKEGELSLSRERRVFRLTTWLSGESREVVDTPERAYEAARMLGSFHLACSDLEYRFASSHPLHDSSFHLKAFQEALKRCSGPADKGGVDKGGGCLHPDGGEDLLKKVLSTAPRVEAGLKARLLPSRLPSWVVHGDPKISNVLFDPEERCAMGLVDLDTCTRHSVLVDLGDAIRSFCAGPEDSPGLFRMEILDGLLHGYVSAACALTREEIDLLPGAGALIAFELASRFMRDVIEDRYFGYDPTRYASRRHHNWARGEAMLDLAEQMVRLEPDIRCLVERAFTR